MPCNPSITLCTHIKVSGVRCGSPALHGEQFCYFHQRMFRGVPTPPDSRLHPIALLESDEAIQASIMEVVNALARNTIDLRRADLILKALYIAVKHSRRSRFDIWATRMVTEIPNYPAPPRPIPIAQPEPTVTVAAIETAPAPQIAAANPSVSAAETLVVSQLAFAPSDAIDPTQRKPPSRVPASKQRKNAAHSAGSR